MIELTHTELNRLETHMKRYTGRPQHGWTEEKELDIVEKLNSGISVRSIIRDEHISGRKIVEIKKKYKLYGA
jgi:hypothetical protein